MEVNVKWLSLIQTDKNCSPFMYKLKSSSYFDLIIWELYLHNTFSKSLFFRAKWPIPVWTTLAVMQFWNILSANSTNLEITPGITHYVRVFFIFFTVSLELWKTDDSNSFKVNNTGHLFFYHVSNWMFVSVITSYI